MIHFNNISRTKMLQKCMHQGTVIMCWSPCPLHFTCFQTNELAISYIFCSLRHWIHEYLLKSSYSKGGGKNTGVCWYREQYFVIGQQSYLVCLILPDNSCMAFSDCFAHLPWWFWKYIELVTLSEYLRFSCWILRIVAGFKELSS